MRVRREMMGSECVAQPMGRRCCRNLVPCRTGLHEIRNHSLDTTKGQHSALTPPHIGGRLAIVLMRAAMPPDSNADYTAFIRKPFQIHDLVSTLTAILGLPDASESS